MNSKPYPAIQHMGFPSDWEDRPVWGKQLEKKTDMKKKEGERRWARYSIDPEGDLDQ